MSLDPKQILSRLREGNRRFKEGKMQHPHQDEVQRRATENAQKPIAVVVTCSDSRVSPAILFDQGIGDLFVIRCAGNLVDELGLASIEYAVEHLGARIVIVLGHQHCGAVLAALQGEGGSGHIPVLLGRILQHLQHLSLDASSEESVKKAVWENARQVARGIIEGSKSVASLKDSGRLELVCAYYSLDSGAVEVLE